VTVEADAEHPFFVYESGWSSPNPARTSLRYGLNCRQLVVGDECVSLTHEDVPGEQEGGEGGSPPKAIRLSPPEDPDEEEGEGEEEKS